MKVNSLLVRRIVCLLYIKVLPGFNQSESIVVISVTDAGLMAAEVPLIRFVLSTEIQAWGADKSAVIPIDVNESVSLWRLNIVDSQQGHLTVACDLRDIVYTFLLTCQHTNKAYLFSTTRRTWTYIHIQCPCNLRLIYSYRCFSNSAVFSL